MRYTKKLLTLVLAVLTLALGSLCVSAAPNMQGTAKAAQSIPTDGLLYNGEAVRELYSLSYASRTYHKITKESDKQDALSALLKYAKYAPVELHATERADQVGFLVITEKGKYPIYLGVKPRSDRDYSKTSRLVELAARCNTQYEPYAQWLVYMSESNIEKIELGGTDWDKKNHETAWDISATVTDRESIEKISAYFKNLVVSPDTKIITEEINPDTPFYCPAYSFTIHFKSGVSYHGENKDGTLLLSSSDMKYSVAYSNPDGTEKEQSDNKRSELCTTVRSLPGAVAREIRFD